jgi:hypothetical protein
VAFLAFGLIGKWYLWPALKDHDFKSADLREYRDLQRSCRSHPARRVLLPGRYQRAGHGGGPHPNLRLSAASASELGADPEESRQPMNPRTSLYYLAGYLLAGGLGLPMFPVETWRILLSNRDYGDIFPRVAGMLMSGLG